MEVGKWKVWSHGEPCRSLNPGMPLRCECGKLLVRFTGGRLELKCSRCKRVIFLEPETDGDEKQVEPSEPSEARDNSVQRPEDGEGA